MTNPVTPDPLTSVEWWTDALGTRNGSNEGMAEFVVETLLTARPVPDSGLREALAEVGRVAVGIANDWMGDPDHGHILDPLVAPVEAWRAALVETTEDTYAD